MPARRPQKIRSVTRAATTNLPDPTVSRAVDQVRSAAQAALDRDQVMNLSADLVVGKNVIVHGLGRTPKHVNVTPSVADATFAWAWDASAPHADRQLTINVVGVNQPGAKVLVS